MIKMGGLPRLIRKVKNQVTRAVYKGAAEGSELVEKDLQKRLRTGQNASGSPAKRVKETTMNQPIRRGGPDKRIRKTVNPSPGISIYATGETARSIQSRREANNEWEVSSITAKGNMILEVNAKMGRDPIQAAKPQIDIVEKEILKEIDRLFK